MNEKDSVKIFYSWQSDLPNSETRSFIQSCIDAAVKALRDTVYIEADRDTKGEYGTPDIAETIFSKIDDCDIFVADVSIVNKYESQNPEDEGVRFTPNPNVLVELGYAATVVGWENIICLFDSDYGTPKDLPFDIDHRRVTCYSLKENEKSDERKRIREIIAGTVMNLLEHGKRVRNSFSNIIIGSYDFERKEILHTLQSWNIASSPVPLKEREERLNSCRRLVQEISEIKIIEPVEESVQTEVSDIAEENREIMTSTGQILKPIQTPNSSKWFAAPQPVFIKPDDQETIISLLEEYLDVKITADFFCLGNLKRKVYIIPGEGSEEIGTEEERQKYQKIEELQYLLLKTKLLDMYISTFKDLCIFPLAARNISSVADENIDVYIQVESDTADIVIPGENLIDKDLQGVEGVMCEDDLIKKFFMMPENSDIQYDEDISYSIDDIAANARHSLNVWPYNSSSHQYDKKDYAREISKYIEKPMEGTVNEYAFYLRSLRPGETSWIGPSIVLKPRSDKIFIKYQIHSKKSDGHLSGTLVHKR